MRIVDFVLARALTVNIIKKIYETGRKVSEWFKDHMQILFDE